MNNPEESPEMPEDDSAEPSISNDPLSAEMHAALHAAKEEDQANQSEAPTVEEGTPPSPEEIADVQEAIAAALAGAGEETLEAVPKAEDETAMMKDQLIRAMAEMENLRKRTDRELADARKYAVTGFARDMVNIVENLQLALQSISEEDRKSDDKLNNLAQGVEMTFNELIRIFQGNGIVRIDPVGEKFNHNHHQAVAQVEDAEAEPGTVTQVLQAGYIIHDRLLRPAMVTVAKGGNKA